MEINPKLTLYCSCSINEELPEFCEYDFIISCGLNDSSNYIKINQLARNPKKCNILCFERDGKFFMLNDFIECTIVTTNGTPKSINFPSFKDVIEDVSLKSGRNDFLNLFYESIHSKLIFKYMIIIYL